MADWPVLGKKLKSDAKKFKVALPKVSSAEVQEFTKTGKLTVDGIDLVSEDLQVQRGMPAEKAADGKETRSERDVLIILDVKIYSEFQSEGYARELINRVQRLRKAAGLNATDEINVQYDLLKDTIEFEQVLKDNEATLLKLTKRPLTKFSDASESLVLAEEEQQINDTKFKLRLLKLE